MARSRVAASPLVLAGAGCLTLALATLALPTGPTYDPYSWLIWGRDLAHFGLSTRGGGTSWKPLPALIDAFLTPLGQGAADGWVVVARAGALFAVFMAFRLAWRLAPRGGRPLAGVIAAATLLLTQHWLIRNGSGGAEGLMVAFGLLAVDRHLDGHRLQAFALLVAAGLIRVEIWPFAALYGGWLWWQIPSRRTRVALAAGALLPPLLWFGGDWVGSGHLTSASGLALRPIPGTPGDSAHPALAVGAEALDMFPTPAWIALAIGVVWAAVRRNRLLLVLATSAALWTALVAVMAERGYPGEERFLYMACAIEAVLAGVGAASIVRYKPALTPFVTALVIAGFAYGSVPAARQLPVDAAAVEKIADMDAGLANTVREAGGAADVMRCGAPTTKWYTVTALAYDLGVPATDVRWFRGAPLLKTCSRRFLLAKAA